MTANVDIKPHRAPHLVTRSGKEPTCAEERAPKSVAIETVPWFLIVGDVEASLMAFEGRHVVTALGIVGYEPPFYGRTKVELKCHLNFH